MIDDLTSAGRRAWLGRLGQQALALAAVRVFGGPDARAAEPAEARPRFESDPFTLGVASGFPGPHHVVLWTRLAPRLQAEAAGMPATRVAVQWELAADAQFRRGRRSGVVATGPERAHSVHVRVDGLEPGRRWFYRFRAGDAVSPVGRTRTAPAPDAAVERLRLGVASCQHYEQGYYAAHRDMAEADLDLVMFLGDYIYEHHRATHPRMHDTWLEADTLDGYRRRYAHYKADPDLQAAHAAHPWVLMWDDHEVENDYAGEVSPSRLGRDAFLARRTAAYQAYLEHQPVDPTLLASPASVALHGRMAWGTLADLWTLDERQYRSPQACDPGIGRGGGRVLLGCAEFEAEGRSMLGAAQEHWIAEGLRTSTARWQLVGHGTPISPQSWRTPVGEFTVSDGWDGYLAARRRMMQAVQAAPQSNVVFLAGDVHRHMAARLRLVPDDERSPVLASEFVTSSITSRGLRQPLVDLIRANHPDLLHARSDERGYLRLDVSPDRLVCEMLATPAPVLSRQAPLRVQARFEVEPGRPGPRPV